MDIKRRRITGGILAVLAATVVGCGSANAGSASRESRGSGGGSVYIMADDQHGVGPQNSSRAGGGAAGSLGDALGGPQLQP